jgi:hypothetical protein
VGRRHATLKFLGIILSIKWGLFPSLVRISL